MNIHPLFVHFPIAFLILYSVLELARFGWLQRQSWIAYTKTLLLVAGSVGAFLAAQTGEMAEDVIRNKPELRQIFEAHQLAAKASEIIFGILAFAYIVWWCTQQPRIVALFTRVPVLNTIRLIVERISRFILTPWVCVVLAVLGLTAISLTGGFGGVLVYGRDADPFFAPVIQLLGL